MDFAKTVALKVTMKKANALFYTNNETSEGKAGETHPLDIATRKTKYLGRNLTQEVKDPYSEEYTTRQKDIKKGTNEWKYTACS